MLTLTLKDNTTYTANTIKEHNQLTYLNSNGEYVAFQPKTGPVLIVHVFDIEEIKAA